MSWWHENRHRIIQNNIRDLDIAMDLDQQIEWLEAFNCNVFMVNCGGITAFYPTQLACHYKNPFMAENQDFMRDILDRCHAKGIRVIARFDFSKTDESYLADHPDWYCRNIDGDVIQYNGIVAACVNGEYQQSYSLKILQEVLETYDFDGIFFNMFGYFTRDVYSGRYLGICQCDNCKRKFQDSYCEQLPLRETDQTPVMAHYQEFKQKGVLEMLDKIHALVKAINPEIAICTYHHHKIDMIRNESNSSVDRPQPFWLYSSSENVATVEGSYEDKVSANCVINAVDLFPRFVGVSKYLNQIRLLENMASGSGLDYCIVGSFADYPDRANFELAQQVFRHHAQYERFYGQFQSLARIMILVQPTWEHAEKKEFLGLFKMLKEAHKLFRVVTAESLVDQIDQFDQYDIIFIPELQRKLPAQVITALEQTSASVIATGLSFADQPDVLQRLFGVKLGGQLDPIRGSYVLTEPKSIFTSFPQRDWLYLDGAFQVMASDKDNTDLLPLISSAIYGPPERCFGHAPTDSHCLSLKIKDIGSGRFAPNAYFPWHPGTLYYKDGYEDYKDLVLNLIDSIRPENSGIQTNAPECVELFFDKIGDNQYLLQLINLSGFNGTTVRKSLPIHDIEIALPGLSPVSIQELGQSGLIDRQISNPVQIPWLDTYLTLLIQVKEENDDV